MKDKTACIDVRPHLFEPRYDEVPIDTKLNAVEAAVDDLRKLLIRKVYIKDICVKCGHEVKR